jgi:hypothetical protein
MKITDRDLKFTSEFLEEPVPQDQSWRLKYFKTSIRNDFLRYFMTFGNSIRFREHTGFCCSERYVKKMKSDLLILEKKYASAKRELDFELVAEIEMGMLKLS